MTKVQCSNKVQLNNEQSSNTKFDLDERTLKFSKELIALLKAMPRNILTIPIVSQLLRSGTSIGANCCEAIEAGSKKDFINKITIAKKEAKETRYWLRLLVEVSSGQDQRINGLLQEAQELNLILSSIVRNSKIGH